MFEQLNRGIQLPSLKAYRDVSSLKRREMRDGLIFSPPRLFGFFVFAFPR